MPGQGRGWELTTSPDPVSAVFWRGAVASVAPDGNAIAYLTVGPLPGYPLGQPTFPTALSRRGAEGWAIAQTPGPYPQIDDQTFTSQPLAFDPDYATSLWQNAMPSGEPGLFRRDRNGEYSLIAEGATLLGASVDLERVVFSASQHLLDADAPRGEGASIYELEGSALRLVDVAGDGSLLSDCGSTGKAVSADARRVYFTTRPACTGAARVYLDEAGAGAIEISASRCSSDCGPPADVDFVGATPSGSSAFLVTAEKLTDEDANSHPDLYRYDAAGGELTLISTGPGADLVPTSQPIHASGDGSRVYFEAAEPGGAGEQSFYLADENGPHRIVAAAGSGFVQSAANGRYAVLSTSVAISPADSDAASDVYRYDATDGSFAFVSAGPVGGNGPFAAAIEPDPKLARGLIPGWPFRGVSDDGSRIFFATAERLVAEDGNDVSDVYEWANGNLSLISSGAGGAGSTLIGSSADGGTVFFKTADTLLPGDRDGADLDYYAARISGGFAEPRHPIVLCSCFPPPRPRIDRAAPVTASAASRIRLRPIGAAARKRIATSGWIALLVEVPRAGRLSVAARARIGSRSRTVAATSTRVSQPGSLPLRMRLSQAARQRLAAGESLSVQLRLRLSGLDAARRVSFALEGGR